MQLKEYVICDEQINGFIAAVIVFVVFMIVFLQDLE